MDEHYNVIKRKIDLNLTISVDEVLYKLSDHLRYFVFEQIYDYALKEVRESTRDVIFNDIRIKNIKNNYGDNREN